MQGAFQTCVANGLTALFHACVSYAWGAALICNRNRVNRGCGCDQRPNRAGQDLFAYGFTEIINVSPHWFRHVQRYADPQGTAACIQPQPCSLTLFLGRKVQLSVMAMDSMAVAIPINQSSRLNLVFWASSLAFWASSLLSKR